MCMGGVRSQAAAELLTKENYKCVNISDGFLGNPENKGWKNWADFLGTKKIQNADYWNFKKARNYVRKKGLKNQSDWNKFIKNKPQGIPSHPQVIYKNKGLDTWLFRF